MNTKLALEQVLSLQIDDLRRQRQTRWRELMQSWKEKLFIFGAGELGFKTLEGLLAEGIRPLAVLDNRANLSSPDIFGVPVLTPGEAVRRFGTRNLCLVAVFNTSAPRKQLASLGFQNIVHSVAAFAGKPDRFLPYVCLDDTDVIFRQSSRVRAAFELMADEASRQVFVAQLRHRLFLDFEEVKNPQTSEMKSSEYFPNDLYIYLDDEVLVDCGAFRGDTIARFLEKRGEKFLAAYGLEPDSKNFDALQQYVAGLDSKIASRIKTLPCGVGSQSQKVAFNGDGSVRSNMVNVSGIQTIQLERIDDICREPRPSLIKMDIEGVEPDAMRGAQKLIQLHAPVLAICVYHASEHLWEIPLLAAELNSRYRLFLRAHAEDCWDVSCYAVPENRLVFHNSHGFIF